VRGLARVGVYALLSVLCIVLNREAEMSVGRPDKAVSPTFFNTCAAGPVLVAGWLVGASLVCVVRVRLGVLVFRVWICLCLEGFANYLL
jgi:hypothetical protein